MYETFYNLKALPFQLSPDPRFFFESMNHHRVMAYFRFGLNKGEGFLLITGEIGTGKTLLANTLFNELRQSNDVAVGRVVTSQLGADDLLRMAAASFGLSHSGKDKATLLQELTGYFVDCARTGRKVLLVVDDAQELRPDAMDELRILSNLQDKDQPLLQIFLLGQVEFRRVLSTPDMEHFRQRIIASHHLGPLDRAETQAYIEHRLALVGWNRDPSWKNEAYDTIYAFTQGIPRKVNSLCDRVLMLGYLEELHEIGETVVQQVIGDLQMEGAVETALEVGEGQREGGGQLYPSSEETGKQVHPHGDDYIRALSSRLTALEESLRAEIGTLRDQLGADERAEPSDVRPTEKESAEDAEPHVVDFTAQSVRVKKVRRRDKLPLIACVVGARPNLMKIAPLIRALGKRRREISTCLVHTGQHYDDAMNGAFFRELGIAQPDLELHVGAGSHAMQTALIMQRFEPVVAELAPAAVMVVGDVNSTVACALVSSKLGIPIMHVEAGLRSFDRTMPEEINRVLTDQMADLLFITEPRARENLVREGIEGSRIHYVGNVMIDTLHENLARATPAGDTLCDLGHADWLSGEDEGYALLTLHRPSNVDDPVVLRRIMGAIVEASKDIPVVFPIHPRTREKMLARDLEALLLATDRVACVSPLGYLAMLGLMKGARLVLTDSGGIQEETTALGVPCITLRENTERPITIEQGTNTLVGTDSAKIIGAVKAVLEGDGMAGRIPDLWDGKAAERIAGIVCEWLAVNRAAVISS